MRSVFIGQANDRRDPYVADFLRDVDRDEDSRWFESMDGELLASAYAAADVFVLASKSENLPLVALEAQAAGTRLVLSDLPQHREVFGEAAAYCRHADVPSIGAAVEQALGTVRRTKVPPIAWSWARVAESLEAVYDGILHSGRHVDG